MNGDDGASALRAATPASSRSGAFSACPDSAACQAPGSERLSLRSGRLSTGAGALSGFAGAGEALKLAAVGGIGFFLTAWVFETLEDRLSTGPAAKL